MRLSEKKEEARMAKVNDRLPRLQPPDRDGVSVPVLVCRRRFFGVVAGAGLGLFGARVLVAGVEVDGGNAGARVSSWAGPFREVIMLDRVSVSVFEACLGQTFHAIGGDGTAYDFELFEAKALEPRPGLGQLGIREDPFALKFRAPAGTPLGQGTYALEHAGIARFDVFLVPIGVRHPSQPVVLEAVFG
jgi:hypothetical protein